MVVSERQQDPLSCPLLVPSKVGQIRLLIRKSLWLVPYLSFHSLKQRKSSISLNNSVSIPCSITLLLHGAFYLSPCLGLLRVRMVHRVVLTCSLICNPSGGTFWKILKTWQSSQDNSLEALNLYFLTKAVFAFDLSYYYKPLWSSR